MKKQLTRLFSAAMLLTVAMSGFAACDNQMTKYNDACAMIESGNYKAAYNAFKALGDYKDSEKHLSRFMYFPSVVNYDLYDRSGVMTVTLGSYNLPVHLLTVGTIEGSGNYTKDGWYTYDNKGNWMRQAVLYNNDFLAYDYTYDANNNIIKAEYTDKGVVVAVHDYAYNADGVLIREAYTENGVVYYDYMHTYDANNNLIKSVFESSEGDHIYEYVYDANGKMLKHNGQTPDGYFYTNDYTYNDDGSMAKRVCFEYGELSFTIDYTYDNVGKCIKEERSYPDETKDVFTKEYDENGNLTKEVHTYADGTVESVELQYVFTYVSVDVPEWTMKQLIGLFEDII